MQITPYTKNAKKHPKEQIKKIADSIREFGMNQPIVVDKKGVIIVGHGRYEALKLLGREPTEKEILIVDLTEEQVKAYRLADNKLNESDWDMKLVIDELKGLSEPMLDLTGFDKDLILESDEADDEVPAIPDAPHSVLGDLYELGNHRVLCGDSTKLEDVERLMDGKKADMVFTDPPYELDTKGGGVLKDAKSMRGIETLGIGHFDPFTLESRAKTEVFCCNKPLVKTYLELAELWKKPYDICFYKKENTAPNYGGHLMTDTEYLILIGEQSPNKGLPKETYSKAYLGKKDADNKTAWSKPVGLVEKFVILYSRANEIVLDTFLGSGSTLIASQKTGRICYGMELDPKYTDVIIQRYCDYTHNNTIIKNGKEITWQK